jgi:hypothetical protein
MNKFLVLLSLACALTSATPTVMAQAKVSGHSQTGGNTYANSRGTSGVSAAKWSHQADVIAWLDLGGGLYRRGAHLSKIDLAGHTAESSSARVVFGGRTVSYRSFQRSGSYSSSPRMYDVLRVDLGWSFGGLVGFNVTGRIGAGSQFGATWNINTSAREAQLNGAAQVWGYGEGKLSLSVLWGAAKAKVSATLNYLNTTINFALRGTTAGLQSSSASLSVVLWELYVKFKAEVLRQTVASSTLVNERGPTYSRRLF